LLQKIRDSVALAHFVRERLPHYGPLVAGDLRRFREEIVQATVGAGLAMVAGLFFACFVSVAIIISFWNGPYRIVSAWLICALWAVVAIAGLRIARRAVIAAPPPFHVVGVTFARDYEHIVELLSRET
jgi:uncharacterized membrane protein YqjE